MNTHYLGYALGYLRCQTLVRMVLEVYFLLRQTKVRRGRAGYGYHDWAKSDSSSGYLLYNATYGLY
ncbi:hypothetical protein D3C81_1865060 [compost metagenome]